MQPELFSDNNTTPQPKQDQPAAPRDNRAFLQAYDKLNPEQKKAVDAIEGPVLVAAGPGTGKTQILATRVGKILLEQDVSPHNILCLTFTDAGVAAMRDRLIQLMGPTAHRVHIHSFHSFCNQVIQENLDIFGSYKQYQPISELETVDLYRALIEQLPQDNSLKKYKYDKYTDLYRIKHLFDLMKKENLSPEDIAEEVEGHMRRKQADGGYTAKAKGKDKFTGEVYQKGDFRSDWHSEDKRKFTKLTDAATQYPLFLNLMHERERYDYNDMLLWVIKEFQNNEQLLSDYQERYLYFLVDEYQDTNGAQNKLLELMLGEYDQPNVFVVGDDDQAIFKFQGANLDNIKNLKKKFDPELVVLQSNYRSSQPILDASKCLIENNKTRLLDEIPGLSKNLTAQGPNAALSSPPRILHFKKTSDEAAFLVKELQTIHEQQPETLSKTAVIYRTHRQAADLITVLEKLNIPINVKKKVDILHLPLVNNLVAILSYLSDELHRAGTGQHRLYRILHYNYFDIEPLDLSRIAFYLTERKDSDESGKNWRQIIANKEVLESLQLKNPEAILKTGLLLDSWLNTTPLLTLQSAFENIINEGGILDAVITGPERAWNLQVLNTFFDFIKQETVKDPTLDMAGIVHMIPRMKDNYIQLPLTKVTSSEQGVNFLTAHAAKGLEFELVYVIGCTEKTWDNSHKSGGQFTYPETLNADNETNIEDERRLFYVAMTRAEKVLTLTWAHETNTERKQTESQFITEICSQGGLKKQAVEMSEEDVLTYHYNILKRKQVTLPLIDKNLIDSWLSGYKLSVTHLNKYLRCPLTFYFEAILRVPGARNAATGFGSAMHDTLDAFFKNIKEESTQTVKWLHFLYREKLERYRSHFTDSEYQDYLTYGLKILAGLHEEQLEKWLAVPSYKLEVKLNNAIYKGVPLKGVIDKVEIYQNHVNVIDYKTGRYNPEKLKSSTKDKNKVGGDYWRQLVFYKMLLMSDNKYGWAMSSGRIDYLEPDKYKKEFKSKAIEVTTEHLETVGQQIVDMQTAVKNYAFDTTCEDDKCRWCRFAAENYDLPRTKMDDKGQVYDLQG